MAGTSSYYLVYSNGKLRWEAGADEPWVKEAFEKAYPGMYVKVDSVPLTTDQYGNQVLPNISPDITAWFNKALAASNQTGVKNFTYNQDVDKMLSDWQAGQTTPGAELGTEPEATPGTTPPTSTPPAWLPPWYNQNAWIPTATPSPQVEFMETINKLLPQMSPYDYQPWLSYLRTQQPDVFTGYTPEAIAQYKPPSLTPQQERELNVPERYDQAKGTLLGGLDPDSPAREWLNSIFSTGQQLAPKTAAPESAPSKMQQQDIWRLLGGVQEGTGLLGSPTSYGVSQEQAGLWQPWLEQFLAPTTRSLPNYLPSNAPSWLSSSGMQAPKTSVSRAGTWANPRWL